MELLYHYFDASTGPFRNLSDLTPEEAAEKQEALRRESKSFAGKRSADYLQIRRELEQKARNAFIAKGGLPVRQAPHYMTFGECPWLLDWYPEGRSLSIPLSHFKKEHVSFTYGDLFPTMRVADGKPYRGQVYTLEEIIKVVAEYGWPQGWNASGALGPERYIEAQIWDETPLCPYLKD
ncbi:hypothetical protein [Paenibacillus sp. NFR01]|uniref:hypothetical protein n=1 Tax=Paenibacillus sp. NFR01 TaxID=1566279 RepID=UPI0008CBF834|nr:hypothetical protein [Paenibacillus sp. NFR01]SEU18919.1 hypothetical protein SAMN03159358_3838 [Paenibacillus sp. NFR01]